MAAEEAAVGTELGVPPTVEMVAMGAESSPAEKVGAGSEGEDAEAEDGYVGGEDCMAEEDADWDEAGLDGDGGEEALGKDCAAGEEGVGDADVGADWPGLRVEVMITIVVRVTTSLSEAVGAADAYTLGAGLV
jgi:hypothetical protein